MSGKFDADAGAEISLGAVIPKEAAPLLSFLEPPQAEGELGRVGDYVVKRILGSGGMGVVFAAEDESLHRPVAIKFLRPELAGTPANRERFIREARAAAAAGLHSDYIVPVLHVGVARDVPYLVTPLLLGESLQERLDRTKRVELRPALVIARDAALGLASAHAVGLVHRDIKPANIWLESDRTGGPFRRVKLLDFGLARHTAAESSLTASGMIVGTPDFMAPEQVEGLKVDHRADLFSLGAVLYTMLAGEAPFQGRSAMAVLLAVTSRSVPPIQAKVPDVPEPVANILSSLLEKDAENRPDSAQAVVEVLDGVLAGLAPSTPMPLSQRETPAPFSHATIPGLVPKKGITRRRVLQVAGGAGLIGAAGLGAAYFLGTKSAASGEPIKVGILYSSGGALASSEVPLLDSTLLAIEEVNRGGGVLGRTLQPVIPDVSSDSHETAKAARKLLTEDKAAAIFGCWLSSALRGVSKEVERHDGLLFFPIHYEGLAESPRVVVMGLSANQHVLPVLDHFTGPLKRRRFLLLGGSDVYSYATHQLIRDWLAPRAGVQIVDEMFLPFGTRNVDEALKRIAASGADAVFNTIDGATNFALFPKLRAAGMNADRLPVASVSVTERELGGIGADNLAGHYLAGSWFQSVARPAGRAFLDAFEAKYGRGQAVSDLMASAYISVKLWVKAAEQARSVEPAKVVTAVKGMEIEGVSGTLRVDPDNLHMWRPWRIGRVQPDGTVMVVAESAGSVRPIPYPDSRDRARWNAYLDGLFAKWGGRWEDPAKP
jgi:urea transport system substrate-binding protein